jgi:dTDP-4-dehydrorhamnose reductase
VIVDAIAVFGGSGQLGSEVVYQALQEGEQVATLVRDKIKLTIPKGSGGGKFGQPITGATVIEVTPLTILEKKV